MVCFSSIPSSFITPFLRLYHFRVFPKPYPSFYERFRTGTQFGRSYQGQNSPHFFNSGPKISFHTSTPRFPLHPSLLNAPPPSSHKGFFFTFSPPLPSFHCKEKIACLFSPWHKHDPEPFFCFLLIVMPLSVFSSFLLKGPKKASMEWEDGNVFLLLNPGGGLVPRTRFSEGE